MALRSHLPTRARTRKLGEMTRPPWFTALLLVPLGCVRGAPSTDSPSDAATSSSGVGRQATAQHAEVYELPDFELETLSGGTMRLSDQLGKKVILLDFWATFCEPCLSAMPHLNELYRKYEAQGFVILGINIDGPDSRSRVRLEVRKTGAQFPILLDSETEVLALYNPASSTPYSILIDREGNIVQKKEGFSLSELPVLEKAIADALSGR